MDKEFTLALKLPDGYTSLRNEGTLQVAQITIVGDGPGGLSAALFLARSDNDVTVYGTNTTVMHFAFLNNYLGVDSISGTDFQAAAKNQVTNSGATLLEEEVRSVTIDNEIISVATNSQTHSPDFLVLSEGKPDIYTQCLCNWAKRPPHSESSNHFSGRRCSCRPRHSFSHRGPRSPRLGFTTKELAGEGTSPATMAK